MAVRLRLKRTGRRHLPCYRLNAIDSRAPRDGRVIEELGLYDPLQKQPEKQISFKRERIEYWLSVGAQPSETVANLLEKAGIAVER
ncbi:MAG: 30S ribosomal protein S16 [Actinobacteria bacterium]|nr:30S ribosomal protein S16 [Actinomycetota bacterium]